MRKVKLFYIIVLVILVMGLVVFLFFHFTKVIGFEPVTPVPDFTYSDSLSCEVVHSTFRDIGESLYDYLKEKSFSLVKIHSESPILDFAGFQFPLEKEYEDESKVVFQTTQFDQAIHTIHLSKTLGTFTRSITGLGSYFGAREIFHPQPVHYIIAQQGRCK